MCMSLYVCPSFHTDSLSNYTIFHLFHTLSKKRIFTSEDKTNIVTQNEQYNLLSFMLQLSLFFVVRTIINIRLQERAIVIAKNF